ncbi:LCP family protein required for cell wall assembly [Amycolatopsis endophytica]|uniref:LCP family protein required for cell wall assembly n=1 Tax=Amycolatopsis endophytica TaxID=860233 RepID=A0A853BDN8_9PSEU|nr:LCP family protein [Amycolatopsis endophytica]NYI92771.1 LCP family protein required for cell wall assembly [Amycolatopsis endophytica]
MTDAPARRGRWRPVRHTAVGLASLLVLAGTGFAWTQLSRLDSDLATADVIAPSAQLPAGRDSLAVAQNILLVGLDSRTDVHGNPLPQALLDQLHAGDSADGGDTTDTMIVVHVPAGGGSATAISLPRDSYVQIAGGHGKHKINSAYTYGKQAALATLSGEGLSGAELEREAAAAGARTAIETVEDFTGLAINHYAAVNLAGFYTLSNAVGGVPVCLKAPVHDSYSGADFPAGEQTLSGAQALAFVRQRHGVPGSDLGRIARQQAFLSGMAEVVLDSGTLTDPARLSALVGAVTSSVILDRGWDVLTFAEQMHNLTSDGITFATIPVQSLSLATPYDGDAVKVDPTQVQGFVDALLGGASGRTSASSGTATTPASVAKQAAETAGAATTTPSSVSPESSTDLSGCVS